LPALRKPLDEHIAAQLVDAVGRDKLRWVHENHEDSLEASGRQHIVPQSPRRALLAM
jgi:hypothetical protein